MRKLSPIYGLKFYVPPEAMHAAWPEQFYFMHLFDHPRYNNPDELCKPMLMDIDGNVTGWVRTVQPRTTAVHANGDGAHSVEVNAAGQTHGR
jgi:hypothetical protein